MGDMSGSRPGLKYRTSLRRSSPRVPGWTSVKNAVIGQRSARSTSSDALSPVHCLHGHVDYRQVDCVLASVTWPGRPAGCIRICLPTSLCHRLQRTDLRHADVTLHSFCTRYRCRQVRLQPRGWCGGCTVSAADNVQPADANLITILLASMCRLGHLHVRPLRWRPAVKDKQKNENCYKINEMWQHPIFFFFLSLLLTLSLRHMLTVAIRLLAPSSTNKTHYKVRYLMLVGW